MLSSPFNNSDTDSLFVKLKTCETVSIKLNKVLFDNPRQLSIFNNSSETFLIDKIANFSFLLLSRSFCCIFEITEFKFLIKCDCSKDFGGIEKFLVKKVFIIDFAFIAYYVGYFNPLSFFKFSK